MSGANGPTAELQEANIYIIDRRKNPKGKSLVNSQRFFDRVRKDIRKSLDVSIAHGTIVDVADEKNIGEKNIVTINHSVLHEPSFRFDMNKGVYGIVLPGNRNVEKDILAFNPGPIWPVGNHEAFKEGDMIYKPSNGRGRGSGASDSGDAIDDFLFILSPEEYSKLFLEDLELPNQEQRMLDINSVAFSRAGYTIAGAPANLSLLRTLKNSYGRRIGLRRPKSEELEALEEKFEDADEKDKVSIFEEIEAMKLRMERIPYIDPFDVRYNNFVQLPQPKFKAVMYCLMDCSYSMTEHMKDLAKRFYVLLYRFLKIKYDRVEIVFIRHTHTAEIVDEDTFFYSPESGGTVVSTALTTMIKDIADRYDPAEWNIYAAQASDGDNYGGDNEKVSDLLVDKILPIVQYYAYIETSRNYENNPWAFFHNRESDLWQLYKDIVKDTKNMAMKKVNDRKDIYPVFRQLFAKKE